MVIVSFLFPHSQADQYRSEAQVLGTQYQKAAEEVSSLRVSLDESRTNGERLHRESELVVKNVNQWVKEQK